MTKCMTGDDTPTLDTRSDSGPLSWPTVIRDLSLMAVFAAALVGFILWLHQPAAPHLQSYMLTKLPEPPPSSVPAGEKVMMIIVALFVVLTVASWIGDTIGSIVGLGGVVLLFGLLFTIGGEHSRKMQEIENQIFSKNVVRTHELLPVNSVYHKIGKSGGYFANADGGDIRIGKDVYDLIYQPPHYTSRHNAWAECTRSSDGRSSATMSEPSTGYCLSLTVDTAGQYRRAWIDTSKGINAADIKSCPITYTQETRRC